MVRIVLALAALLMLFPAVASARTLPQPEEPLVFMACQTEQALDALLAVVVEREPLPWELEACIPIYPALFVSDGIANGASFAFGQRVTDYLGDWVIPARVTMQGSPLTFYVLIWLPTPELKAA